MLKQKLIDVEERKSPLEIGEFLMDVGRKLFENGEFDVVHGGESHRIAPTGRVELEVQYKTKGDKHKFEIEIQWVPGKKDDLKIE